MRDWIDYTCLNYKQNQKICQCEAYYQGRTDAIDEFLKLIREHENIVGTVPVYLCENIAERLREQKNE